MMVCPQCGKRYPPGVEICQADGSTLSPLNEDPYLGYKITNFEIKKRIGRGGFGLVYLAEHVNLGSQVAIKILRKQYITDEQLVERFKREARVSSQLRHPNVVQISDFGYDDTIGFYYVMEYLDGISLSQVMKSYTRGMPLERLLPILQQICSALDMAHGNNVVHRDLKPSNIFLIEMYGKPDVVKILDFGIAKVLQNEEGQGVTATGQIVGSPRFMSPEQARGRHNEVDPRSDIYALGVMVFWMLTGRLPFESKQLARLLFMHIKAPPPTLNSIRSAPHFTPQLEAVIAAALAKEKPSRPSTAGEMYRRLEEACNEPATESAPPPDFDPFGTDEDDRTVRVRLPSASAPPPPATPVVPSAIPDTPSSINMLQKAETDGQNTVNITAGSLQPPINLHEGDEEDRTHIDNIDHIHKMLDEREKNAPALATSVSRAGQAPRPQASAHTSSPPAWSSAPPNIPTLQDELPTREEPTAPHPAPPSAASFSIPGAQPTVGPNLSGPVSVSKPPPAFHNSAPSMPLPVIPPRSREPSTARRETSQPSHPVAAQSGPNTVTPPRKKGAGWKTFLLVLLVLVLLGEIAFLGWRWWSKQQRAQAPSPRSGTNVRQLLPRQDRRASMNFFRVTPTHQARQQSQQTMNVGTSPTTNHESMG